MRIRAPRTLLALLGALALLAAACSDDDSADVATDDPATTEAAADDTADDMDDTDHGDGDMDHGDDHAMGDDDGHMDGDHMDHEPVDVTGDTIPTVEIEVWSDPAGGINVLASTTNYTVAPEAASTEHVEGEGHFHIYLDGEKRARYYNECIHVPGVVEGDVEVMVELSANDHRPYAVDGEPIMATTVFAVPAHEHDDHSHDDPVAIEWDGDTEPALTLEVVEDPKSGWNALIDIAGLEMSCENASGDHVAGQGHLHIYANGEKIGRLYGGATHITALPEGEVEITVAAYANDHSPYLVDGTPVETSTTITVAAS